MNAKKSYKVVKLKAPYTGISQKDYELEKRRLTCMLYAVNMLGQGNRKFKALNFNKKNPSGEYSIIIDDVEINNLNLALYITLKNVLQR